jgi:hypothetical protein
MVTTDLMTRARAGDGDAFRELTEPYRRELQVHCYSGRPGRQGSPFEARRSALEAYCWGMLVTSGPVLEAGARRM